MWTKGLIMLVSGIAGFTITMIWIIVLIIKATSKNKANVFDITSEANDVYLPGTSQLRPSSELSKQSNYNFAAESTVLLNETEAGAEDTIILEEKVEDTELL